MGLGLERVWLTREARRDMNETDQAHFKSLWLGHEQLDWTSEPIVI